ncbi:MAG TPA: 4Fe-4S double cluster binding domain-containing protein [Anaerolineae bacterium]|nr:4Fe-4S double cluster binding domain-containing protein [Anaerolineae bacterium]
MPSLIDSLCAHLAEQGLSARIVSVARLGDLRREIQGRHAEGQFDAEFFRTRLTWFEFALPDDLRSAASLIVVAKPRPQHQATFTRQGRDVTLTIPPTYVGYEAVRDEVGALLSTWLAPHGYHVSRAHLPLKVLAVRSGLADYGRNNITYVPGMGSFHQLNAFYSDLPCTEDAWREPHMMDRCQQCHACRRACPTGAIAPDRFLLHAELCLTYHNEKPAETPFSASLDPAWHNCLVGCMHCQRVCPETLPFLDWVAGGEEFDEEETALLLSGVAQDQLPPATVAKLGRLDVLDSLDTMPRNLGALLLR